MNNFYNFNEASWFIGEFFVSNDQTHEDGALAKDDTGHPPGYDFRDGDEWEDLRAIASGYDARAARDRREPDEQESGRGSSATDMMLYSFKVPVSQVSLPS